jgi:hypothetical protein
MMNAVDKGPGSIHVLGSGIRSVGQITLESNYLLHQMDKVFHCEHGGNLCEYIASTGAIEIPLSHLCSDFKSRANAYQEICDTIVASAADGLKCAYLAPGNPIFLNTVVLKLKDATSRLGIPFFVYAGVSSIDTLLTDLSLPIEMTGLQCFEATHFVRMRPAIDKRVPLFLFQPGLVDALDVRHGVGPNEEGIKRLQSILLTLYSEEQVWLLVRSAAVNTESAIICSGQLNTLADHAAVIELGTLVVPGDWTRQLGILRYLGIDTL